MSCKRFESQEDLLRERAIMLTICKDAVKLGENDLDGLIPNIAFVEIKTARCNHNKPVHYLVSVQKYHKMQDADKLLPAFLFIQWADKLTYISYKDLEKSVIASTSFIAINGRAEREGSVNDREQMIHVPPSLFKVFVDSASFLKEIELTISCS